MFDDSAQTGPTEDTGPDTEAPQQPEASKSRSAPTKRLPTNRIAFPNQLNVLRAYAAASQNGSKAVENKDVASITNMSPDTVSLANPFFADVGLIVRTENGYVPAPEVLNFGRVYQWNPDKASTELAPKIRETWFAETLLSRLSFAPMSESDAITELAKVAQVDTTYKQQLGILLDYLGAAGLVEIEGGMVKATLAREPATEKPATIPEPTTAQLSPPSSRAAGAATPSGLPLLIQGLLQQLPADDQWTREGMKVWLDLAEKVFQVVYKIPSPDKETQP